MTNAAFPAESLRRALANLPTDALSSAREAALAGFAARGLPTTREEDWKYTDLAPVAEIGRHWLDRGAHGLPEGDWRRRLESARQLLDADWFVIANGRVVHTPTFADADKPVRVARIGDSAIDLALDTALAGLNAALLADGLHIVIPRGACIERPIGLLIADEAADEAGMSQCRVSIEAEPASRVAFVEYLVSSGQARHYANAVTEVRLARDARVDFVRLQQRARHHSHTARTIARLADASALHYSGLDLGGALVRNDLDVELCGRHAEVTIDGLFIAGTGQHIDNHVRVDHRAAAATSVQDFRGILGADCRCVWNGKAIVHPGADGTDARQTSHNLLLTEGSEIDAKPELEIYADDVKCSHGATVGQLDENALFYLRTRGLDRQEATRVLTRAFGATIVGRAAIPAMAEPLAAIVESRLGEITETIDA